MQLLLCLILAAWFIAKSNAAAAAAAATAAPWSTVNVTVDNVVIHLTQSEKQLGERYYLDKRTPHMVITCRAETTTPPMPGQGQLLLLPVSFDWRKTGGNQSLLAAEPRAVAHTECSPDGLSCVSTLRFRDAVNSDVGAYECHVTPRHKATNSPAPTVTATGAFLSRPLITLLAKNHGQEPLKLRPWYDLAVYPNDTVEIICQVEGNPPGDIRWTKELDPSFNLTGNVTLVLSGLSYERDRGHLTCESRNEIGANSVTMFLRVRSPRAFVAPLVGICILVLVMLAIVVTNEVHNHRRRRRLEKAATSDVDKINCGKTA